MSSHIRPAVEDLRVAYECVESALVSPGVRRKFWQMREKVLECSLAPRSRLAVYHTLWWLPSVAYVGRAPSLERWRRAAQDLGHAPLLKILFAQMQKGTLENIFTSTQVRNVLDFLIFTRRFGPLHKLDRKKSGGLELVITIGVAGSGKSTYIKRHYPHYARVSMDEARGRFSLDPGDPVQSQLAYRYCIPILDEVLARGRSAVWDATAVTSSSRKQVVRIGRKHGAKIVAVFFDLPLAEISRRNTGRRRVVPMRAVKEQFEQLEPPHRWEFDKIIIAT